MSKNKKLEEIGIYAFGLFLIILISVLIGFLLSVIVEVLIFYPNLNPMRLIWGMRISTIIGAIIGIYTIKKYYWDIHNKKVLK